MAGGARRNSGAKIIPMEIKKAKGTYRAYRDKTLDKPPINPNAPIPPERLTERAREIFNGYVSELSRIKLASATFTNALASLCELEEEIEQFILFLRENGKTYKAFNKKGYEIIVTRPEVVELRNARKMYLDLIREFGLTPSSFAKTGAIMPSGKDEKENEFSDFG
jgi:P27 family predicted phage terminase small subunit